MKTHHQLINHNSNDLSSIATNSVDLIVTSPPYPMIEMWDPVFIKQDPSISNALALRQGATAFEKMHRILDPLYTVFCHLFANQQEGFIESPSFKYPFCSPFPAVLAAVQSLGTCDTISLLPP